VKEDQQLSSPPWEQGFARNRGSGHRQKKGCLVYCSINVRPRLRPGFRTRLVIILVIVLLAEHWYPDQAPLLVAGMWFGAWLLDARPRPAAKELPGGRRLAVAAPPGARGRRPVRVPRVV
jgi:hypothetical protein